MELLENNIPSGSAVLVDGNADDSGVEFKVKTEAKAEKVKK